MAAEPLVFHVEINNGPTQVLEVKTGIYELAAMAALALLDFNKREDFDVVKIWIPDLLPDYGPYFYSWSNTFGIRQVVGNDTSKW